MLLQLDEIATGMLFLLSRFLFPLLHCSDERIEPVFSHPSIPDILSPSLDPQHSLDQERALIGTTQAFLESIGISALPEIGS
jgi:hypothetical protein